MAVTPNYGWPVPVATDYVKDGWEAISDLGNAIDTTVAGLGSGLTFISTTTVSNQSTAVFDNVFSTSYKSYLVVLENFYSHNNALEDMLLQFRFGATTQSTKTTNYYSVDTYTGSAASTVVSQGVNNGTFARLTDRSGNSTYPSSGIIYFEKVGNASEYPKFHGQSTAADGTNAFQDTFAGTTLSTEIYKGFLLYFATGNITATVTVYGLATS